MNRKGRVDVIFEQSFQEREDIRHLFFPSKCGRTAMFWLKTSSIDFQAEGLGVFLKWMNIRGGSAQFLELAQQWQWPNR